MKLLLLLLVGELAATLAHPDKLSTTLTCSILKREYPNITFFPGDSGFREEIEVPWSARSWREPACIFAPVTAEHLSFAVKKCALLRTKFVMRGGGHMPIASTNSIDSKGILISSTNLDRLVLSADKNILSIGSGRRWSDAYELLEGTGRLVLGARSTHVGVPGMLLGGGISFHSYEYGLASTNGNIQSYECVLASGKFVKATANNEYSDLFWALQGGGNSLCLVTSFGLKTIPAPSTMLGSFSYGGSEVKGKFMDSVFKFAMNGDADPKGVVLPVIQYASGTAGPAYSSTLFYNGNNTSPSTLQDFLGNTLTPLSGANTLQPLSLGQYSRLVNPAFQKGGQSYGVRQRFHLLPILANRDAMQLVHDMYFDMALDVFSDIEGAVVGMAFNPITKRLLTATNAKPGSLQGLDETPALWIEQTYSWNSPSDDMKVEEFVRTFNAKVMGPLKSLNATGSYYYLNEADEGQPVFESYPPGNVERLKRIRRKYDPAKILTDLMPGGFKFEVDQSVL